MALNGLVLFIFVFRDFMQWAIHRLLHNVKKMDVGISQSAPQHRRNGFCCTHALPLDGKILTTELRIHSTGVGFGINSFFVFTFYTCYRAAVI
jgi:hypothetical protein